MTNHNKNQKENLDLNSFFEEYILNLLKQTMETLMKEELTNVLKYNKYSYEGYGTGNSRNGYYTHNMDALHLKLRRDTVSSDAVYFILGVDEDGYREVLDFFIGVNESAYVWEDNLRQIKERSVDEFLLFVMDGLSELDDSVHRVYPKADIQRCIVHSKRQISQ